MNILQTIFSVKNEYNHKVLRILGLKVKFLHLGKISEEILLSQNNSSKKILNTLENQKKEFKEFDKEYKKEFEKLNTQHKNELEKLNIEHKKEFEKLNIKYKKEFITDNIDNPKYYKMQREIYNFYKEMETIKFYKLYQDRFDFNIIKSRLDDLKKRFNNNAYILTDLKEDFPKGYVKISIDEILEHKDEDCIFIVAYNKDYLALNAIDVLLKYQLKYYAMPLPYPLARYFHTDKNAFETLDEEQKSGNWHFCPVDFENIFQMLQNCKNLEGNYVEIGTFKGDSASAALNYMKRADINKKAYFLDTFIGFDYEEAYNSQDALWQNTHKTTSFEEVKKRLEKYENANVIQANIITDELPQEIEKICLANIDVDMYEAVKAALYKVKDKIVKNGIIIAEDYGHTPGLIGAQKATKEFLEENPDMFIPIYLNSGQMLLIKKG